MENIEQNLEYKNVPKEHKIEEEVNPMDLIKSEHDFKTEVNVDIGNKHVKEIPKSEINMDHGNKVINEIPKSEIHSDFGNKYINLPLPENMAMTEPEININVGNKAMNEFPKSEINVGLGNKGINEIPTSEINADFGNKFINLPLPDAIAMDTSENFPEQKVLKQHKCETCGKSFSRFEHLKRHVQCVHEGQKNYKCPLCEKAFSR